MHHHTIDPSNPLDIEIDNAHHARFAWHGLIPQEYYRMLDEQHGACWICKRIDRKLRVDHDHQTGKVRGLLCSSCNTGLGMFADSTILLSNALAYLGFRRADEPY